MTIPEYGRLDGLALAALVRRGEISATELLEEAIARTERVNGRVNAIITPLFDEARRAAAALPAGAAARAAAATEPMPFLGLPFLLKDLDAAVAAAPLAAGCRFLSGYRPQRNATIVERFRAAGTVIFGKTNTPELGMTPYTEPVLWGPTRNPWNLELTSGGSSGGSAAAVAAGIVPVAHANDGGGSIRMPASCCGLFGLKPTRARTPVGPQFTQIWSGWAIGHVISRSVRDSAAMLDAISGPEPTSPYHAPAQARPFLEEVGSPPGRLRVAFTKRPHLTRIAPHADCAAAVDDAARLLANLGHEVEEADLDIDGESFARDFFLVVAVEIATLVARGQLLMGRRPRRGELETSTRMTATIGRQQSAVRIALARDRLEAAARRTAEFFGRYDLLVSPTLGLPPVRIGSLHPRGLEAFAHEVLLGLRLGVFLRLPGVVESSVRRVFSFMPFTPLANVTGQPAMNVPLYWNAAGVPIGAHLTARFGDEATLFRVAAQLEEARPWRDRRPPVHADAPLAG